MPVITLPDGTTKKFTESVSGTAIAADIGPRLAKAAVAIRVDGQLRDLATILENDVRI